MSHKNNINENLLSNLTEAQLDELLAYTPAFSETNLANIKARAFENINQDAKRKFSAKKFTLTLAAAVMLLAMSTAVLAAVTDLDFGQVFNSFFNNPAADNVMEVGKTVENNGIEITLMYAYTDGNHVYAMLEVRDLQGSRLSEHMRLMFDQNAFAHIVTPVVYEQGRTLMGISMQNMRMTPFEVGEYVTLIIESVLTDEIIYGSWELNFPITAMAERTEFTTELQGSRYFERIDVEISPMVTFVFLAAAAFDDEVTREVLQSMIDYTADVFDNTYITLKDGSKIELFVRDTMFGAEGGTFVFTSLYFDVSQVYSITVMRAEYRI